MDILHITRKTLIAKDVQVADSLIKKTKGLLGENNAKPLLFYTRFGIHTFGMKFPLDIIILDKNSKVVTLKENLKPWRIFLWNPKYSTVLELPAGTINKTKTVIGDLIKIS